MAYANRNKMLVLATGNKSEAMMGYCTLYGDTIGSLAPIGDLYKTEVYQVARYINRNNEIIPNEIIEREPSAELRPGQKDTDSLPPYDVLDLILKAYRSGGCPPIKVANQKIDYKLMTKVFDTIEKNKFKAAQCAPALKWRT
jgi:NAD+ synthetase